MSRATARAPRTLYAQCEQHANEVHSRRLAELAGLAPLLARMDEVMPTLKKHGLELHPERVSLWRSYEGTRFVNTLRIVTSWCSTSEAHGKWLAALREAGFKPVHVSDPGPCPVVRLRKGHALVTIDATAEDAAALRLELAPPALKEAA